RTGHELFLETECCNHSTCPGALKHSDFSLDADFSRACFELRTMQLRIDSIALHKFVMGTLFHNGAFRDHDNLVGIADGTEPMSNSNNRLAFRDTFQGF